MRDSCSPQEEINDSLATSAERSLHETFFDRARKKPININILGGTVSGTNANRPWDKRDPPPGQIGTRPWDKRLFLFNSTVKSPFCPVYPWGGWGFVAGTIVPQGRSEKCLCVSVYWLFSHCLSYDL